MYVKVYISRMEMSRRIDFWHQNNFENFEQKVIFWQKFKLTIIQCCSSDSMGESESGLGLHLCGLGLGLHLGGLGLKRCGLGLWSHGLRLGLGLTVSPGESGEKNVQGKIETFI